MDGPVYTSLIFHHHQSPPPPCLPWSGAVAFCRQMKYLWSVWPSKKNCQQPTHDPSQATAQEVYNNIINILNPLAQYCARLWHTDLYLKLTTLALYFYVSSLFPIESADFPVFRVHLDPSPEAQAVAHIFTRPSTHIAHRSSSSLLAVAVCRLCFKAQNQTMHHEIIINRFGSISDRILHLLLLHLGQVHTRSEVGGRSLQWMVLFADWLAGCGRSSRSPFAIIY